VLIPLIHQWREYVGSGNLAIACQSYRRFAVIERSRSLLPFCRNPRDNDRRYLIRVTSELRGMRNRVGAETIEILPPLPPTPSVRLIVQKSALSNFMRRRVCSRGVTWTAVAAETDATACRRPASRAQFRLIRSVVHELIFHRTAFCLPRRSSLHRLCPIRLFTLQVPLAFLCEIGAVAGVNDPCPQEIRHSDCTSGVAAGKESR